MKVLENAKDIFTVCLEQLGLAWWVEVVTYNPCCTYYFGPFVSSNEAKFYQAGYIEDLEQEQAQIVTVDIKQGQQKELTICDEELLELSDSISQRPHAHAQVRHR